jgi:hypothetical protein
MARPGRRALAAAALFLPEPLYPVVRLSKSRQVPLRQSSESKARAIFNEAPLEDILLQHGDAQVKSGIFSASIHVFEPRKISTSCYSKQITS